MSKEIVTYVTSQWLNVKACQEVVLCLRAEWRFQTVSGDKYIRATVENTGRYLGGADDEYIPTPWNNPRNAPKYQYTFAYDSADLLVNESTGRPYEITCKDILDVVSSCIVNMIEDIEVGGGGSFSCETLADSLTFETDTTNTNITNVLVCDDEHASIDVSRNERRLIPLPSHGLGIVGDIVLLQGNYLPAQADDPITTADLVALIIDNDNIEVLAPGIHRWAGHGLSLGVWYALDSAVAGNYIVSSTVPEFSIRQNAFIALDADTILIDLQEAFIPQPITEATIQTKVSHGFIVGDIVSRVSGVWQAGRAGKTAFYVVRIIDADNFVISRFWAGARVGLPAGILWAIDPGTDGAIVDVDTLDPSTDPITRVGYSPKAGHLLGAIEYPVICCGSGGGGPDPEPELALVYRESYEGGDHDVTYSDGFGLTVPTWVNDAGRAVEGSQYIQYVTAVGNSDYLTYTAAGTLPGAYKTIRFITNVAFKNLLEQSWTANGLADIQERIAGSWSGLRITPVYSHANGGFRLRVRNNQGTPIDTTYDGPAHLGSLAIDKWYRFTVDVAISSAIGAADASIKWKVEELQGSETTSTDGTVAATIIPEQTLPLTTTHGAGTTRTGFNYWQASGGYGARSAVASGTWGIAIDDVQLYGITI